MAEKLAKGVRSRLTITTRMETRKTLTVPGTVLLGLFRKNINPNIPDNAVCTVRLPEYDVSGEGTLEVEQLEITWTEVTET